MLQRTKNILAFTRRFCRERCGLVFCLLGILFATELCIWWPDHTIWNGPAWHAGLFPRLVSVIGMGGSTYCLPHASLTFERDRDGHWNVSNDKMVFNASEDVLEFKANVNSMGTTTIGLWAPVIEYTDHTVNLTCFGLDTPQIRMEAINFFVDNVLSDGNSLAFYGHPNLFRIGPGALVTFHPLWALHDVAITSLLVPFTLASWHLGVRLLRRRDRALCRYELAGLPMHATCPECGQNPIDAP